MNRRSIRKTTDEFAALRQRLLKRGYTFRSFALKHGYKVQTVYCAAHRTRSGKKTLPIIQHLETFAYES